MDNAQKAIMIGVGLFITIIIIAAVMLITGMGQDLMNSGTQQLSQVSSQLQRSLTVEYDGKTMAGSQVLAAVKKYLGDPTMVVAVESNTSADSWIDVGGLTLQGGTKAKATFDTKANCYVTTVSTEANDKTESVGSFTNSGSPNYIQTTRQYDSRVIRIGDGNGDVVGIVFTKHVASSGSGK